MARQIDNAKAAAGPANAAQQGYPKPLDSASWPAAQAKARPNTVTVTVQDNCGNSLDVSRNNKGCP